MVFEDNYVTAKCNLTKGKYMACNLMYRGNFRI